MRNNFAILCSLTLDEPKPANNQKQQNKWNNQDLQIISQKKPQKRKENKTKILYFSNLYDAWLK